MNILKTAALLACVSSLGLVGCDQLKSTSDVQVATIDPIEERNAKILTEVDAKVAVTINKTLSTSVINTNTGELIKPCEIEIQDGKLSEEEVIKRCYPKDHDPNAPILSTTEITVREGSKCITIVSGSRAYVFCQPPYNLGF